MHSGQGSSAGFEAGARQLQWPQPSEALCIPDESLARSHKLGPGLLGGWLGREFGSLPVWTVCLSIRPSFPTVFFSLLSFFSPSSSLCYNCLLLWPPLPILSFPSTLGAAARTPCRPSCAKHIRCITAWLLSQHRVSLGLGPPQTAYPYPGRSAGPSEACLLLCPPPCCHQAGFPCSGNFWKARQWATLGWW